MEGELAEKTTFDNQPLEMDWENAVVTKEHYEYLDRLSESLTERYNISEADALDLSWGGLHKTSSWDSLSITEQQEIINTNLQHRSGLKGTKCN
ncbi:hypothetical protein PBT90_18945 [Algoriphagus halophytocola]|uniref:Uncharacterized protein n=1 Tax=Algoriphagus halophytocola TaxID=2991499 RepID=A0ABY6MGR0_9BACT|nr:MULTISPECIES: hypothetical protein [unclassified Algoriphagus]UZD21592.1 hypothetical protein OM944_13075 [Algoriphagus sp. TR-M5]WBL42804.1 hypothetical protein PBT90_18945 [Algoriphagus sp. TR-M9]